MKQLYVIVIWNGIKLNCRILQVKNSTSNSMNYELIFKLYSHK